MLELRATRDSGKPMISCLVEPDEKWWPPASAVTETERELAATINPAAKMFANLLKACAAGGWADPVPANLLALLNAGEAVPKLLQLVKEELARARSGPAAAAAPAALAH
jgi:hypothetical protein